MPNDVGTIVTRGNLLRIDNAIVDEVSLSGRNTGFILVSHAVRRQGGVNTIEQLQLNVNPNTTIINSFGAPVRMNEIQPGMRVDATFSQRMTRSIPPQANAVMIVVKRPARPANSVTTGIVVSVNARENALFVGRSNNPNRLTRFIVTDSTVILNRNGFPITLSALRPGQIVRITHANFQTASIPPQTTAFRIQVL